MCYKKIKINHPTAPELVENQPRSPEAGPDPTKHLSLKETWGKGQGKQRRDFMYEIEKNYPIPEAGFRPEKYNLSKMEIGDSFFIPADKTKHHPAGLVCTSAKRLGIKLTTRKVEGGYRVWRIK